MLAGRSISPFSCGSVLVKRVIHNHRTAFKLDRPMSGRRWIVVGAVSSEPWFRYRVLRYIAVISRYGNRAYELLKHVLRVEHTQLCIIILTNTFFVSFVYFVVKSVCSVYSVVHSSVRATLLNPNGRAPLPVHWSKSGVLLRCLLEYDAASAQRLAGRRVELDL